MHFACLLRSRTSSDIFPGGNNVEILLIFFRLLTMQRKCTFTKRFSLSQSRNHLIFSQGQSDSNSMMYVAAKHCFPKFRRLSVLLFSTPQRKSPMLQKQSQKCASLAAMLFLYSWFFSHSMKVRGHHQWLSRCITCQRCFQATRHSFLYCSSFSRACRMDKH